jgi:serine phosphatase RsbU (regulator of sigma subunit)
MWPEIIFHNHTRSIHGSVSEDAVSQEQFTYLIAQGLYDDYKMLNIRPGRAAGLPESFKNLNENDRTFWNDFSAQIPYKFNRLNLFIRPFKDFCRTCIITEKEIESLVEIDLARYKTAPAGSFHGGVRLNGGKTPGAVLRLPAGILKKESGRFFLEINYLVPLQLKKAGFEIIRMEEATEIAMPMVKKLARAIHSKYNREIRSRNSNEVSPQPGLTKPSGSETGIITEFDDLPDDIKYSNIDNAAHIPTKLLAIGYRIRQVKKGFKSVTLHLSQDEIETMSAIEHMRWSWDKRLNGWRYGDVKNEMLRTHPGLVPYSDLPESEKEKDRELVRLIPSLLNDINFEAFPLDARKIKNLSYALKPQSVIHKILNETRDLNEHIRKLVDLEPEIDDMVKARNRKIEQAIREVEESYNYAKHIQDTFLPDDLYIRELFPESFILYKPKDIVSGDFYFFSRQENRLIFAVADCTGHGIPGALLTTLGYGILDQAVNEIKLTESSYILFHLYSKIHRYLRNGHGETGLSDDMDIILCILDTNTNILTYAGVKNPLYRLSDGELYEYRAQNSPEDASTPGVCLFSSEEIMLKRGDTIYMCSDGYSDQFGGKSHKKYLSSRLKNLLKGIQKYSMPEQGDRLYEEIEEWREENHEDQTDDILVIGIRI